MLHTHIPAEAHAWTLNHIEAKALVFDTRLADVVDSCRGELSGVRVFAAIGPDVPDWAVPFSELQAGGSAEEPLLDVDEDAPCFLQLTSGTTGNPKPWIKTYRSWQAVITHNLHHFDTFGPGIPPIGPDDVNLHFHPMQWASGLPDAVPVPDPRRPHRPVDDDEFDAARAAGHDHRRGSDRRPSCPDRC